MLVKEKMREYVESHPLVKLWLEGLAEGTIYNYTKAIMAYTEHTGKTPQELLDLKEAGGTKAERLLDLFVATVEGVTDSRKKIAVTAIHSFYKNNYLDLASRSGYSKVRYVTANDQACPTQEELREMLLDAHIRNRAIINVASSGGFRVGTLVQLVWGDLKELWKWDGESPVYVKVESKRLKGEGYEGTVEQHTFMTAHACEVLLRYAEWYRGKRDLEDDSPLFISRGANQFGGAFGTMQDKGLRKAVKSLGDYTPHDLRRFAQTQLETARINPNWIKKMQGKKLRGEDNPYSKPKIEEMRKAFKDAAAHLTLAPPKFAADPLQIRKTTTLDGLAVLRDAGVITEQVYRLAEAELKKVKTEQEFEKARSDGWGAMVHTKDKLIEVPKEDIEAHQKLGYVVVGDAYNGNVYMRLRE